MPDDPKYTLIYVADGAEVCRQVGVAHPGMDTVDDPREIDPKSKDKDRKWVFAWDHVTAKGEHVFMGTKVRV